jgi:hypothetical protein
MLVGIGTWVSLEFFLGIETVWVFEPHFFAFLLSIPAFFSGTLLQEWAKK